MSSKLEKKNLFLDTLNEKTAKPLKRRIKSFTVQPNYLENSPVRGSLGPPLRTPLPGPGRFWIESPQPTGYRVPLVSVSESVSQKHLVPIFCELLIQNRPFLKKYKSQNNFFIGFRRLRIFFDQKPNLATFEERGVGVCACR